MNTRLLHSPFILRHLASFHSLPAIAITPPIRLLLLTFVILNSSFVILLAAPPPELTVLRTQYEKILVERVTAPFEAALGVLNTKFTSALDNAAAEAKKTGSLPAVLAIEADKKRIADKLPLPDADDELTPESLKKLRAIYREQRAKLEAERATNHNTILPAYTARLQALETTLTKADRVEEAKEVLAYRDGLASGLAASAPGAKGNGGPKTATGVQTGAEPPAPAKAYAVKGDDRAAAEVILGLGGSVKIVGGTDYIGTVDALPKKKFGLYEINLSTNGKSFLEPENADRLAGLQELVVFVANNSIKDDEALRFLKTCPNLVRVHVENCGALQGTWLKYAAPLTKLETLVALEAVKSDPSGLEAFQSKGLTSIQLRNTAANDATLAAIGRFKKLRFLGLRDTKITDAGMAYLMGLSGLADLNVSHTPVTASGMKALGKAQLTMLGFGATPDDMVSALPQLSVQFPKVESVNFAPGGKATAAHLAAIATAWPKLRRIDFPSFQTFDDDTFAAAGQLFREVVHLYLWKDKITDQHVAGIAQMKKLTHLDLVGSTVTDACLPPLQAMKSLKRLYLSDTQVSDAAVAALRQARPDMKVEK